MGRETCGDLAAAESRDWLCTNGIGGFASGTVAGLLTRRDHGWLIAAVAPPLGRRLLVASSWWRVPGRTSPTAPEYNTVDATLWYVEAIRAAHAATGDDGLLKDLFPVLESIVDWHVRGTRYGIGVDPADGLLRSGEDGVQLTWMDARVGEGVVTPRTDKAVEINALWHNALRAMATFARRLGRPARVWDGMAARAATSFAVPAASARRGRRLRPSPAHLARAAQPRARRAGLSRTLRGDPAARDGAYHQGTVWSWLLGPFALAHFRVHGDREGARAFLAPLAHHLGDHGVGSVAEIFEGDSPFRPDGCLAQAWGVAETLQAWQALGPGCEPFAPGPVS